MGAAATSSLPGALPLPRTRLIGREHERAMARAFMLDDAVPLLTLTGPGGVGKTRLALAIAQDVASAFTDGVVWVDLAPLVDPALVAATVAAANGLTPAADQPVADELIRYLRAQQTLLLLDNCERVLATTGELVARLLVACPALQVLATSRAALHVHAEQILSIPPLAVPELGSSRLERVQESPAVRLFVQRAQAAEARFALDDQNASDVAEICQRLDGLPLALELAAARANQLSPAALLSLLHQRLQILGTGPRDAPARHQTMRDALAWSYALLSPEERAFFRLLSVFSGGWSLHAAAAVSGRSLIDALAPMESLIAQSLVVRQADAADLAPRFTMLEVMRAYGQERLEESGEAASARDRHASFFLQAAHEMEATHDVPRALGWVAQERSNLRAAIAHLDRPETAEHFLALVGDVANAWTLHGFALEARAWLERGLSRRELISPRTHAWALARLAGVLYQLSGETAAALACGEQALALAAEDDLRSRGWAAHWCGLNSLRLGQAERGESFFRQAQAIER